MEAEVNGFLSPEILNFYKNGLLETGGLGFCDDIRENISCPAQLLRVYIGIIKQKDMRIRMLAFLQVIFRQGLQADAPLKKPLTDFPVGKRGLELQQKMETGIIFSDRAKRRKAA